jgi:23S rRNA (cytidine1920-2'-O)/16S rRNA (cytidine1409-2'-O)-methyltransferase
MLKKRIDQILVERGLAETRQKAQALLLAGKVLVDEQKVEKAGQRIDLESPIRISGELPFVSRAGAKLQAALEHFRIPVAGRVCADLGASTGGFTDSLLQNGARAVYAFDVGRGQIAWKLRSDPRVIVRDQFNVRNISHQDLPAEISLITADLSFISLTKILAPLKESLLGKIRGEIPKDFKFDLILLVKPQFEVGKDDVGKGGIVRDPALRIRALESVTQFAISQGYHVEGSIPSPVAGAKGNQEFLLYLHLAPDLSSAP